ncbi:MAG TPA: hypothetical protein VFV34_20885, partial [Blastocatellia bacterium]|nr:hypothetical protein [Blastocatellia bacterium]
KTLVLGRQANDPRPVIVRTGSTPRVYVKSLVDFSKAARHGATPNRRYDGRGRTALQRQQQ